MKVSILILTFNEEANLPEALLAVRWCDDVVIIDSGSTDRTVEIAEASGARVLYRPFDDFARQRNWGLENGKFKNEWVLHLDADEIVTSEFRTALEKLKPEADTDAYRIPSKLILFGQWIRYAGMYPVYQVRLGHRERLRFVQVGHGQREDLPASRVSVFDVPYFHYSFSQGMVGWLNKHIRYAKDEAALIFEYRNGASGAGGTDATQRRRAAKIRAAKIPVLLRPVARFIYIYFAKQGFRDGRGGLAYALMLSVYEGMIALFFYERVLGGSAIPRHRIEEGIDP